MVELKVADAPKAQPKQRVLVVGAGAAGEGCGHSSLSAVWGSGRLRGSAVLLAMNVHLNNASRSDNGRRPGGPRARSPTGRGLGLV